MTAGNSIYINVDSGEKTFVTPRHIVEACGPFDTDPCVPDVMPWRTAARMIAKAEDGLAQPWLGRVWLNPPYGKEARPFLEKMVKHVQNGGSGIALTFVRTDNKAWHELIFPYAKAFLFLKGRVAFCDTKGQKIASGGTMPSVLIAYADRDVEALERAKKVLGGFLVASNHRKNAAAQNESAKDINALTNGMTLTKEDVNYLRALPCFSCKWSGIDPYDWGLRCCCDKSKLCTEYCPEDRACPHYEREGK